MIPLLDLLLRDTSPAHTEYPSFNVTVAAYISDFASNGITTIQVGCKVEESFPPFFKGYSSIFNGYRPKFRSKVSANIP